MKLSECKIGTIVYKSNDTDKYGKHEIGHVIGLTRIFYTGSDNHTTYYVAPIVKFADKEPYEIHVDNLDILTD
jgi:hypothetical protein